MLWGCFVDEGATEKRLALKVCRLKKKFSKSAREFFEELVEALISEGCSIVVFLVILVVLAVILSIAYAVMKFFGIEGYFF